MAPRSGGEHPARLAILSKRPLEFVAVNDAKNNWAVKVTFKALGTSVGFRNVHLDWQHLAGHGPAIQQILRELVERRPCDHEFLLGDFNEPADGPAARALVTDPPLSDLTGWRDLGGEAGGEHAAVTVTVGFAGGSRERELGTLFERFDRIYPSSRRGTPSPRLLGAGVFGQQLANREGIVPSDHLGVFVDLEEAGL